MNITDGLLPGQVLQRNSDNTAYAVITGACKAEGTVELRVSKAGKNVNKWTAVGDAKDGLFMAELTGLKVGGPYLVKLRVRKSGKTQEKLSVDDVFVGDVWILAGQSNMEGVGNLKDAPKPHKKVRAFYMRDEWDIAKGKLHFLSEAVDSFHNNYGDGPKRPPQERLDEILGNQIKGVGPGHAFGIEMYQRTKVPQGLIACAHGGTSMAQWSPSLRENGGASLYGAMMRRFEKLGQPVAGILWYQGESDANPQAVDVYTKKMIELVEATRRDMGLTKLPWFVVQLGCHACAEGAEEWNAVQEQQRKLPEIIENLDVAAAIDLELDDGIHISGKGQTVLGKRLARLADRMVHKNKRAKPGITLKKIRLVPTPDCNVGAACTAVELTYSNVAGGLRASGRPTGFVLLDDRGDDVHGIFKTTLHGDKVLLHTNMPKYRLGLLKVSYGHGRYPYCNVVDGENVSIPAIQALEIDPDQPTFVDKWQTTFLAGVPTVARAGYAKAKAAKGWRKAPARGGVGVLPKSASSTKLGVYVMRSYLRAEDDLEALLVFGANAPFKIWLNGKVLLTDAKCRPPLNPDQYKESIRLKPGRNELMVAFAISAPGGHIGIVGRVGTTDERSEPRITS